MLVLVLVLVLVVVTGVVSGVPVVVVMLGTIDVVPGNVLVFVVSLVASFIET